MIDPSTVLAFSLFENKGVYALLLGSGLSRAARIPTGWEITLNLIQRVAALEGVTDQPDWAAWHREKTGAEPDYSAVLDTLTTTPDERRSILHSYIEPTAADLQDGQRIPTKAHHAIAALVRDGFVRVIVTTNFDRLLENALREAGVEPTVIRSDDDLRGAVPLIHSTCFILKLHGDYLDTRIKNTDAELGAYSPAMDALLDRILDDHGLIICGWSGAWDHALCAAITRAPNRRFPTFWAARGAPSAKADELIAQRRATVISITDADDFFTDLQQKVAAQLESQRPNPRSIELLIATTKRYLSRSEFRIALSDLLAEEYRRLAAQLGASEFGVQDQWSVEEFSRRVARYETAVEPLARIFGIIGRWGDEAVHGLVAEMLSDLARHETLGGLMAWINLRSYPAVLLLYAYGLGALKAGREAILMRWFGQRVRTENREFSPAVAQLLLGAWSGGQNDTWTKLEGLNRHKTPLSNHLHDVTAGWTGDYLFADREHTLLFENFEVLAGLAFLTLKASPEQLKQALETQDRDFVWAPVGRAAWDTQTRDIITTEVAQADRQDGLLKAGFGRGNADHLKRAIESLWRLMNRIENQF